jgi:sulfoxide reductase catalytic subunit YedY
MVKKFEADIPRMTITPPDVFFNRRKFLASLAVGSVAVPMWASDASSRDSADRKTTPPFERPDVFPAKKNRSYELPSVFPRKSLTPRDEAASHNTYYEFLAHTGGPVWKYVDDFVVDPWKIEIVGACSKPATLDLDGLFAIEHEERVYHFRCVERWAMNIPWSGFPLRKLLEKVEPKTSAKYVRFTTAMIPEQMPGLVKSKKYYDWPYVEGLRMDEAMNELTLVATGVYGQPLLKQHGAPVRIITPWKYGYKSPKSIVKIELMEEKPQTFWMEEQPHEYGFVSNVNPNIPHPRWSQQQSHWLDTGDKFDTPIFNGYEKYVGELYPDEPRTLQEPLKEGQTAR